MKYFDDLKQNPLYQRIFKRPWSYVQAALMLSLLQILTLLVTGRPWGISQVITKWGLWLMDGVGIDVSNWYYVQQAGIKESLSQSAWLDEGTLRNVGVILGATLSALLASSFRFKRIKSWKHALAALGGGMLMGYGARIAYGCNIGALYGGIASLSLSGWVFAVGMFAGAVVGGKLLLRWLL